MARETLNVIVAFVIFGIGNTSTQYPVSDPLSESNVCANISDHEVTNKCIINTEDIQQYIGPFCTMTFIMYRYHLHSKFAKLHASSILSWQAIISLLSNRMMKYKISFFTLKTKSKCFFSGVDSIATSYETQFIQYSNI